MTRGKHAAKAANARAAAAMQAIDVLTTRQAELKIRARDAEKATLKMDALRAERDEWKRIAEGGETRRIADAEARAADAEDRLRELGALMKRVVDALPDNVRVVPAELVDPDVARRLGIVDLWDNAPGVGREHRRNMRYGFKGVNKAEARRSEEVWRLVEQFRTDSQKAVG